VIKAPARLSKHWREEKLSMRLPRKFENRKTLHRELARFIHVAYKQLKE